MRYFLPLFALVLAGMQALGQTYTIKIKQHGDKGESVVVQDREKSTTQVSVTTEDGKVLKNDTTKGTRVRSYTETVIEPGAKRPKKYKREYTKAEETEGKKETKRSYAGRTVIFTEKDGKYVVTVEGAPELDKKDLADLTKKANKSDDEEFTQLLPKKPVKVGGTWKISGKDIAKAFDDVVADKSKGEGKLVKVYRKGKQQWGILEFTLDITNKDQKNLTWEGPGKVVLTLDTAIDGSSVLGKMTARMKMKAKQTGESDGTKFVVDIVVDVDAAMDRTAKQ